MKILSIFLTALITIGCVTSNAQTINNVGGGSTSVIIVPGDVAPPTPNMKAAPGSGSTSTLGDLINQQRQQGMQEKTMIRMADCSERAQFAGMMVQVKTQLLEQGKPEAEVQTLILEVLNEGLDVGHTTYKEKTGTEMPSWYDLEFHRVINDLNRMEPTDPTVFAAWVGSQCVQYGPWLAPQAR